MAAQYQSNARQATTTTRRSPDARQAVARDAEEQGYLAQCNEQFREMVEDHEGQAALIALCLGFGVGLVIGYAIGGEGERSRRGTDRVAAEDLGRRILKRIDAMLPEAISRRLG
jgi:hypothetical protein